MLGFSKCLLRLSSLAFEEDEIAGERVLIATLNNVMKLRIDSLYGQCAVPLLYIKTH